MTIIISGSNGISGVDGSSGTPAFQGTDTNSGIAFPAADAVAIITAGVERLRIDSAGKADFAGDVELASINSGPLAGFRNAIINGNFDFWQRGTSFSNPVSGTYTTDRWLLSFDGSGATRTLSRQSFTLGQTDVPYEPTYFFRFAHSVAGSGATYNAIFQPIEGVRTFAGQQVTLSFYAKAAANLTIPDIRLRQYFGTGGSPSSLVDTTLVSNQAVTTSWAKYTYTTTLPSISGKTLGSDNNDYLSVLLSLPINTTFTFDIAQVQLEAGPVATPFERRPIGTELALCQRYYETGSGYSGGYAGAGNGNYFPVYFKQSKRATPTLTYAVGTAVNVNTNDIRDPTTSSANWYSVGVATGGYIWTGTWTASAEL